MGACALSPGVPRTHEPNTENLPPIGGIYLTSNPEVVDHAVTIGYAVTGGDTARISDPVPAGTRLSIMRTFAAGSHDLLVDGASCGTFVIEADRETDIVLSIMVDGCTLTVTRIHGAELTHEDTDDATGSIIGTCAPFAEVMVVALDGPGGPMRTQADESGAFGFQELLPGRYRVWVSSDGGASEVVLVRAGSVSVVTISGEETPH